MLTGEHVTGPEPMSEESEVELLSPYQSLSPSALGRASTRVKRTRHDLRYERAIRMLGMVAGGLLVVVLGLSVGVGIVLVTGMRSL